MSRCKDTRPDPRIAIKEEIMTRNKAAQMKRQLQEKASSIPISPPSPVKSKKVRKRKNETEIKLDAEANRKYVKKFEKPSKAPAKKPPKVVENKEYFPNTLKRPYKTDKVVLKPKIKSKFIGGINSINKRKLLIPKKVTEATIAYNEAENDRSEEDKPSDLSVTELFQISLDTASLTDEDWSEILTCPSPVWWENPPSPEYCEDPISTRFEDEENTRWNSAEETVNADLKSEIVLKVADLNTCIDLKQSDNKFMKKRSKLENLLGSLKNKFVSNDNIEFNIKKDNVHISDRCELNENNEINKQIDALEDKLEVSENLDSKSKSCEDEMEKTKCEEDDILDASLDDELLETLESFYIPIENENVGCDDNDTTKENKEENLMTKEINTKTKDLDSTLKIKETSHASDEIDISMTVEDEDYCVEEENNESSDKKVVEIEPSTSFDKLIDEEYVTLYKIVSNDNDTLNFEDLSENFLQCDDDKRKIDGFYKKRKHSSNKRNSNQKDYALNEKNNKKNEQSREQKLVAVVDKQNIKYCTKCSSIFDTETCMYCDKRTDKETNSHGSNKNRLCAT